MHNLEEQQRRQLLLQEAAAAAASEAATRCEALFFREAEATIQQLRLLAALTDEAAAVAAKDYAEASAAQAAAAAAAACAASAGAREGGPSAGANAPSATGGATEAAAKPGVLSVHNVRPWLQRFCSVAADIAYTLEQYQEQPQLLDPHLPQHFEVLAVPIKQHLSLLTVQCQQQQQDQQQQHQQRLCPGWATAAACCCVRLLLHLVYIHCKVRGIKTIRSLLPQEPELLEEVFAAAAALQQQQQHKQQQIEAVGEEEIEQRQAQHQEQRAAAACPTDAEATEAAAAAAAADAAVASICGGLPLWSSTFALFVWLSLLVLAPFSLLSLDSSDTTHQQQQQEQQKQKQQQQQQQQEQQQQEEEDEEDRQLHLAALPGAPLGFRLLNLAISSFGRNGNAADAAALLLQSLFLRPDVHDHQHLLLRTFIRHCECKLLLPQQTETEQQIQLRNADNTSAAATSAAATSAAAAAAAAAGLFNSEQTNGKFMMQPSLVGFSFRVYGFRASPRLGFRV